MAESEIRIPQGSEIEILMSSDEDLSGCTFITGFYGVGKCGYLSINHLVNELKARKIGTILTSYIPPFVTLREGKLTFPFEIYRSEDLVILLPYFEPYKHEQREFSYEISKWLKTVNIKRAILIGGLDSRLKEEGEQGFGRVLTNSYFDKNELGDKKLLEEGLFVTGPLALFLMFFELQEIPTVAILPYAERARPDPEAASKAVQIVSEMTDKSIAVEALHREAERIEKEIRSLLDSSEGAEEESNDRGFFE